MAELEDKQYLNNEEDEVIGAPGFSENSYGEIQEQQSDNRQVGRLQLKNYTKAPSSGKLGEVAMINGYLHQWDATTDSWLGMLSAKQSGITTFIGYVTGATGTAGSIFPDGWSVSRTSTGVYVVTHNIGDENKYIVNVSLEETTQDNRIVYEADANSFDIEITDDNAAFDDGNFVFTVYKVD